MRDQEPLPVSLAQSWKLASFKPGYERGPRLTCAVLPDDDVGTFTAPRLELVGGDSKPELIIFLRVHQLLRTGLWHCTLWETGCKLQPHFPGVNPFKSVPAVARHQALS